MRPGGANPLLPGDDDALASVTSVCVCVRLVCLDVGGGPSFQAGVRYLGEGEALRCLDIRGWLRFQAGVRYLHLQHRGGRCHHLRPVDSGEGHPSLPPLALRVQ